MKKPTLVVMAAGMGSRYGGLKQIDPVGRHGEIIIDYSLFDAMEAGFERVVFVINHHIEQDFRAAIGDRIAQHMQVDYVFQELDAKLPTGYVPPSERKKPWGTAHAILCCEDILDGPFAVINSDDYYGKHAFKTLYDRLVTLEDRPERYQYCMVGFLLDNTLTDHGSVARGVCEVDASGRLCNVNERTYIVRTPDGPAYSEDGGATLTRLSADNLVSMNMWGFTPSILSEFRAAFPGFLKNTVPGNPEKAEIYIPVEVGRLLREGKADVEVLSSPDRWYGVTYRDDKPGVMAAMAAMTDAGLYPDKLF